MDSNKYGFHINLEHLKTAVGSGLSTKEALERLCAAVKSTLLEYKTCRSSVCKWKWVHDAFLHKSEDALLCWVSVTILIVCSFLLILSAIIDYDNLKYMAFYGLILIILMAVNIVVVLWDSHLCYNEVVSRVSYIVDYLSNAANECIWKPENYPHLCSPYSPCITLQWTYRDGSLVNLPWALLVEGDLVLIRPGQPSPGHCVPVSSDSPELQAGQVYSPAPSGATKSGTNATNSSGTNKTPTVGSSQLSAHPPLTNKLYVLSETPFLRNLRHTLNEDSLRPTTLHNRSRHLLIDGCIEQLAIPLFLIFILCVNMLRYIYTRQWVGSGSWVDMFILVPISVILPLLPLVFPLFWVLLTCYGNARIAAVLQKTSYSEKPSDPFEDTDLGEKSPHLVKLQLPWRLLLQLFVDALMGRQQHGLIRTSNLLHVLGSVTSLCCVDKKGILSWPNPTAEKIFFLRKPDKLISSPSAQNVSHPTTTGPTVKPNETYTKRGSTQPQESPGHIQVEVLDLTHDHSCPFRLEFDDASWKCHLLSLKPLGLAILLNTCNMETQEHYTQFCSHVTCEALYNEDLVPVTNRRCLCEVAKKIGFTDSATQIFKLEGQLSTFRHVQPESVRNDMRFARALPPSTELKFPFPHMVAVIMKEQTQHGGHHLFSQGTADIILDCCVEYWDGTSLCKLSPTDRRKVQDFYQRTSLSAYCTAFAYRPLFRGTAPWLSDVYMKLPTDVHQLFTPSPLPGAYSHFCSTESLLSGEVEPDIEDIEGCFKMQCNQIFIGMVTMQYQAQSDIVQLIEQLEGACIRFVHFSKENELRSRVFSEKMGLESGWNCHISLLSERSSTSKLTFFQDSRDLLMERSIIISPHHQDDDGPFHRKISPWKNNHEADRTVIPTVTVDENEEMDEFSGGDIYHPNGLLRPLLPARCGTLSSSRQMSLSAPGAINLETLRSSSIDEQAVQSSRSGAEDDGQIQNADWRQSLSCLTDSTEQSVPVNFDMSNRAKLPRGIDKIRPHLELVDNVPLLVSLFTDCTPKTTREMISIMQEYGEVVSVLGSSANADNVGIFLQANASIAVEPLYPQVCQKVQVFKPTEPEQGPSPVTISKHLNSIPCSISVTREDSLSLFHIIMQARHYMQQVWNCTQYWICCVVSLSCIQLLTALLMMPPIFSTGQVLWLSTIIIPIISLSFVGSPPDPQVMNRATGKKLCTLTTEMALFVVWCYGSKFLPTVCLVPFVFGALLSYFCGNICQGPIPSSVPTDTKNSGLNGCCNIIYPLLNKQCADSGCGSWGGWDKHPYLLLIAQHAVALLLTIHFVTISISFVHRDYLSWRKSPHQNSVWLIGSFLVLVLQIFSSAIVLWFSKDNDFLDLKGWQNLQSNVAMLVTSLISPVIVFLINELVKWEEIKANVRYQKRARLEFGTKLGMNSPF